LAVSSALRNINLINSQLNCTDALISYSFD
jgi:hypothetical protein